MGLANFRNLERPAPEKLCISLSEAKAHCFIAPEDETLDAYLTGLIRTAQDILERDLSVPIVFFESSFEAEYELDRSNILLPKHPVKSVDRVETYASGKWEEGPEYQTQFGNAYDYVILPFKEPTDAGKRIRITFKAGEPDADSISLSARQAVAQLVAAMFDYRGAFTDKTISQSPIYRAITGIFKRL